MRHGPSRSSRHRPKLAGPVSGGLSETEDLTAEELQLAHQMLFYTETFFFFFFEPFLLGPSFYGSYRDILLLQFSLAKNTLRDALVACAIARADNVPYDLTPSQLEQCY